MKAWRIHIPRGAEFAEMLGLYVKPTTMLCNSCHRSEIPPLEIEWDDGSDIVGDFVAAGARIVCRESVADELLAHFSGFVKTEVRMVDHPKLHRPRRVTRRTPRRVWLPYDGPALCEMKIVREVPLLPGSTFTIRSQCSECGAVTYKSFDGIEVKSSAGRTARRPSMGLLFRKNDLEGDAFFRPQYTGLCLCTDEAKRVIEARGYNNVELLEVGDILTS